MNGKEEHGISSIVISRTIVYGVVHNRTGELGCFILEAERLLVYLAQTHVVQ